jgi:hypothetical protein
VKKGESKMIKQINKPKVNPLSRVPRQQRLVMAIRGGAGVGKSHFIRSMSEAGLGKLCIFDTERKARLLRGVGVTFDALEIEQTDELPEFIDWAISGEGLEQNYGCYALDSWAAYFGAKHSDMLQAVRDRTGDSLAQPSAEELAADQMILQSVLRKLCIESGKCIVIADQIPARGKEAKEDNEIGRVLPMTASGLEYFVDVMIEVSLQERDGEILRVFQVVKSNSPMFEVGFELTGNVTFADFLNVMRGENPGQELSFEKPKASNIPEFIETPSNVLSFETKLTVDELIAKAVANGFKKADIVTASRIYHNQPNIYHLSNEQVTDLDKRMTARIEKTQVDSVEVVAAKKKVA